MLGTTFTKVYKTSEGIRVSVSASNISFFVIAELRRLKAAMRSPIPKEPMHSFSYGHLLQRQMARGRVRTTESRKMAPVDKGSLTLVNYHIRDPYYFQLTTAKTRYL